jgi:O-antigen/teichoic acid export membrane protein
MLLASQFSDLGISTGFVRYASVYLKSSKLKADVLLKATLYFKLAVGLVVLVFGLLFSPLIAERIFGAPSLVSLLRIAFIGSLGLTLWGFLQAVLQAREWFVKYAWINIFNNSLKLLGVILLIYGGLLAESRALLVMALVPFVGFLVDGLLVPKGFLRANIWTTEGKDVFAELFHFSKWVTLSTLCTMFLMRLDVLMLQGLSDSTAVGIYNSANQLAMIFPLVTNSLTIALLPKVSSYRTKQEVLYYVRKVVKIVPVVIVLLLFGYALSEPVINWLFGAKYLGAIPIFKVLLVAFSISVILNPISLILYSLEKPGFFFVVNLFQILLAVPMNYFLIPRYGAVGASYTSLAVRMLAFILIFTWILKFIIKGGKGGVSNT